MEVLSFASPTNASYQIRLGLSLRPFRKETHAIRGFDLAKGCEDGQDGRILKGCGKQLRCIAAVQSRATRRTELDRLAAPLRSSIS